MSQEPSLVVEYRETKERPLKVKLIRGAKGVYRWEISFYGLEAASVVNYLSYIDGLLKQSFGQPDLEEQSGH